MSGGESSPHEVAITGLGLISPLGDRLEDFEAALSQGAARFVAPACLAGAELEGALAAELPGFDPGRYLGAGNFRPLDRTGLLASSAARLALDDAGLDPGEDGRELGLVLGTMFGSLHTISEFDRRGLTEGPIYAKPMDFANSVINAAAGQAAIWHHLTGVNATITGGFGAGLAALGYAADLVAWGHAPALLAGGADELALESYLGFERQGLVAPPGREPRPFDAARAGFVPAEGAALLALEPLAAARARGARLRARLLGWASSFDATRGVESRRAAAAAARAMEGALAAAGLDTEAVDAVLASANGSLDGDLQEALALAQVFGARLPEVPVAALKGSLGEALGVSGALLAAALVAALETQQLPGTRGLECLERDWPPLAWSAEARQLRLRVGLIHASSADGQHYALVIAEP